MAAGGGPEPQVGFDRRAAGNAAGHLRHHDRLVIGERKAPTRPIAHAIERGGVSGALLAEAEHCALSPSCPALCRASTTYYFSKQTEDVDGRVKPGHDDQEE